MQPTCLVSLRQMFVPSGGAAGVHEAAVIPSNFLGAQTFSAPNEFP
jgi:hypothetical protein